MDRMQDIALIAHNIRSSLNVGALLRTADGLGIQSVYLTGYTPYPIVDNDTRLPHEAKKIASRIDKVALGAAKTVSWEHVDDPSSLIKKLKSDGYVIAALEQTDDAFPLPTYQPPKKLALLLGSEVTGISSQLLIQTDVRLEIPMFGKKESFNVSVAAAIALYHCRFFTDFD